MGANLERTRPALRKRKAAVPDAECFSLLERYRNVYRRCRIGLPDDNRAEGLALAPGRHPVPCDLENRLARASANLKLMAACAQPSSLGLKCPPRPKLPSDGGTGTVSSSLLEDEVRADVKVATPRIPNSSVVTRLVRCVNYDIGIHQTGGKSVGPLMGPHLADDDRSASNAWPRGSEPRTTAQLSGLATILSYQ